MSTHKQTILTTNQTILTTNQTKKKNRSNNLSETLYTIRKQQKMSLKEDQEELKTGEKKSNTVKMNDDDEDDDEKTKTSFRLGEGISPRDTLAVQGTVPVLEQLKQTSIQKVKDFLMETIKSFTTTKTNVQMLQQYLLKYKYYIVFLNMHSPSTYEEIVLTYTSK